MYVHGVCVYIYVSLSLSLSLCSCVWVVHVCTQEAIDSIDSGMMATAKADGVKVKCLLNLAAAHMKLEAWEPVVHVSAD